MKYTFEFTISGCATNCAHCYVDGGPAPHALAFFPRNTGDTPLPGPVWKLAREEMYAEQYRPNAA